ncbi:hypothetical protein GOODEAATRI_021201 [Goodea atripinnis]|uniref:Uncharacterized protein n=1 Tax=Goodea atripinnis TaxID=208336 RepID=A0ABV0NQF5_9TELE
MELRQIGESKPEMYSAAAAASWPPVSGTASRIVIQERGGVWGLSLTKMHGMRWKVNSNLKTKERRNMKGDGCLDCNKNTEMTCRSSLSPELRWSCCLCPGGPKGVSLRPS